MDQQQERYNSFHHHRVRSHPAIAVGDEVCLDNPPTLEKTPAELLADDNSGNLQEKATAGYYFLEFRNWTVKFVREGIEEVLTIDRVTPINPRWDSVTLKTRRPRRGRAKDASTRH